MNIPPQVGGGAIHETLDPILTYLLKIWEDDPIDLMRIISAFADLIGANEITKDVFMY